MPAEGGPERPSATDPRPLSCLTVRSVAIGLVMCALAGLAGPYWNFYLSASSMFADYNAAGPVFFLLALILIFNLGLGLANRRLGLSGGELRTVTAMTFTGGAIATSGLVAYLVPGLTAPFYHATQTSMIRERVWPHLRTRLFALDPNGGTVAIEKWWAGLRADEAIPWGPWIEPLAWWGVLAIAIFACMMALMVIMRKQWVDHEHLSFPIAQVPAELCRAVEQPGRPDSILRSRAFWSGCAFAFVIGTSRGLGNHFGVFPGFSFNYPITGLGPLELRLSVNLVIVGLVFLVPARVAFSIWSLCLVSWVTRSFIQGYNLGMNEWMLYGVVGFPELQHLSMGSLIAFTAASLWAARRHLARVGKCVVGRDRGYDRGEAMSYRAAAAVIVVGCAIVIAWLWYAGLQPHWGALLLLITLVIYYGLARVVAQCGLPAINSPVVPSVWLASVLGSGNLGAQQVTALGGHLMWHQDLRNSPMSGAAHGMYLTGRRSGGLFWAMLAGLVAAYVAGSACTIWLGYRQGGSTLNEWYVQLSSRLNWMWAASHAGSPTDPSYAGLAWTAFGVVAMGLLIVAHRTFFWWPLHPVGFLTSGTYIVTALWFSIFLSWLAKVLVVGLGGRGAYRTARSFFIGLVLGSFTAGGVWAVIDTIADQTGGAVFYI